MTGLMQAIIAAITLWTLFVRSSTALTAYNIIDVKLNGSEEQHKHCVIDYYMDSANTTQHNRGQYHNVSFFDFKTCIAADDSSVDSNGYVIIKYRDDCDINDQINTFRDKPVIGLLIAITCDVDITASINITNKTLIENDFSVSLISDSVVESLRSVSTGFQIKLFSIIDESMIRLDLSMFVIWLLACFTVVLGSYWSGLVRLSIFNQTREPKNKIASENEPKEGSQSKSLEEEPFLNISPVWVMVFVVGMALMLLALYFFFKYLVYLIIGLFTIASMASVFACGEPILLLLLPTSLTQPAFTFIKEKWGKVYVYQLVLLIFAFTVSITWLILRKESFSWTLQDILGICFSLNMLRTIRLPSYKICTVLLSLLFFYDIFFVFITPLFTSKGNSVMVDVATGGATNSRCGKPGEQLPMVLRVPHLLLRDDSDNPLDVCFPNRDSILGFGDILVPGLLVSYCHAFDLIFEVKFRIYYITTCVCYGLGLIVTFAGLYLMDGNAQPALLYLVPFTLIPPLLIAWYRKEISQLWNGPESHFAANKNDTQDGSFIEDNRESNLLIESNNLSAANIRQSNDL